jgi:hypothetical protein
MPNFRFFRKFRAVIFGEMASATRARLQKPGTTTGSLATFAAIPTSGADRFNRRSSMN